MFAYFLSDVQSGGLNTKPYVFPLEFYFSENKFIINL